MAKPASTPTIMATDFPTWSSSLEDSTQNIKLHHNINQNHRMKIFQNYHILFSFIRKKKSHFFLILFNVFSLK